MHLKSKIFALTVSLFAILLFFGNGWTDQVPDIPGSHVVDLAGIIGPQTKIDINRYLKELEQKTAAQMAILTVKSLEGQSIEAFSINVAHDKWKLGQQGKDNGVLLTVALKERKYRIEVGYGLEGVLPDSLVGGIGRSVIVPYFKKGQYSQGVMAATITIANKIASDAGVTITGMPEAKPLVRKSSRSSGFLSKLLSVGFFIILFLFFIRRPRSLLALFLLSSMGGRRGHWGGSSGGFGGGGFGGFSGGGGGFGGGGASGGW